MLRVQMTTKDFQRSPSGRVIVVGNGNAAYHAFVPNPLPPDLPFDRNLVQRLSAADRALGELAGLARTMPTPHLLIGPFIRRESVLSSRIEGTESDLIDLYAYEAGQLSLPGLKRSPPESDIREVRNYVLALEYGLERLSSLPVSLRYICELHERLMSGVRGDHATPGEFRRSQNWIGAPGCTLNTATYVPPPASEMAVCLDAFERYLYVPDDYPPLIRLAFIHQQFESIHPFLDGNGRIGRLLISLLTIHWNLLPSPLLYLSAFFERRRQEYYDLLLAVNERGAWREWVEFFLIGVAEQADDALARAKRLQDLQAVWRETLTEHRASALLLHLADRLFETPVVTIPQVASLLAVTYRSAQQNVEKLVARGILRQIQEGPRGKVFIAPDILQISRELGEGAPLVP